MNSKNSLNISKITLQEREAKNGHKGSVIWLTGLSASGKSTIAQGLASKLFDQNVKVYVLDGDKIRTGLCQDLNFSHEDRTENIRRIGEVSKLFLDAGMIVIVAFISPYCTDRDKARHMIDAGRFIEVFVDCPIEVCEKRDPKGLYAKARNGEIADFTGISAPYELPQNPEIHLKTDQMNITQCIEEILNYLRQQNVLTQLLGSTKLD